MSLADPKKYRNPLKQRVFYYHLAHAVKDQNGRAFNRTAFLAQHREMMQTWAYYLDGLKSGEKVIPFKKTESE